MTTELEKKTELLSKHHMQMNVVQALSCKCFLTNNYFGDVILPPNSNYRALQSNNHGKPVLKISHKL